MRYYDITITDPNNPGPKQVYTSWVNGQNDPGALDIVFDAVVADLATLYSNTIVQILGIPLQSISNAYNLANKNITVSAGFKSGLPLADPTQAGVLFTGQIIQPFGNWQGNEMTLDLVVIPGEGIAGNDTPSLGTFASPINGQFAWKAKQPLSAAIAAFLTAACPSYKQVIQISPNLYLPFDMPGVFRTLQEFATWVKKFTVQLLGGSYTGVCLRVDAPNTIVVYDSTTSQTPVAPNSAKQSSQTPVLATTNIRFQDLIGQPTWMGPAEIQFKCPMRADLHVGGGVVLPAGYYGISPSDVTQPYPYRDQLAQQGKFTVIEIRHTGHFRQADANSWATSVRCALGDADS